MAAAESLHDPIGPGEQDAVAAAVAIHDRYPSVDSTRPDGDEIAIRNAIEAQTLASAEAIHDPFVSPGVLGEAVKTNVADVKFVPGVTDFPTTPQPAPDNRVVRALEQGPQVIPYLSQGLTSDDVVGARPDDRADRFAHSNVQTPVEVSSKRLDVRMERRADGGDRRARSRPRPRTGARLPAPAPARRTLGRLGSDAKRAFGARFRVDLGGSASRASRRCSKSSRSSSPVVSTSSYRGRRGGSFTIRTSWSRMP